MLGYITILLVSFIITIRLLYVNILERHDTMVLTLLSYFGFAILNGSYGSWFDWDSSSLVYNIAGQTYITELPVTAGYLIWGLINIVFYGLAYYIAKYIVKHRYG